MGAKVPAVEHAMEVQVGLRALRKSTHPLWESAVASGNGALVAECHALAMTLRVANRQAQRIAAIADGLLACPDGLFEPGHGAAA